MAPCHGCEQSRVLMRIMMDAGKEWISNPMGPSLAQISQRLRDEAIARGELDKDRG